MTTSTVRVLMRFSWTKHNLFSLKTRLLLVGSEQNIFHFLNRFLFWSKLFWNIFILISQCWAAEHEATAARGLHPDHRLLQQGRPGRHGGQGGAEGRRGSLGWPLLQLSFTTSQPHTLIPYNLQPPRNLYPIL